MIIINGKFLSQRITGTQRFARELLNELDKICGDADIQIALPKNAEKPDYKNIKSVVVGKKTGTLWELTDFAKYVKKQKGISLNLCNSGPLSGKKIVTILDVKVKTHPEFYGFKFRKWYNILFRNYAKRALQILTISEFSKSEIIKYFKVDEKKIEIIYCAWQHFNRIGYDEGALEKYNLEKGKYYFAMSSFEPNKNFKWIAQAANNVSENFAIAGSINEKIFKDGLGFDCPSNMKLLGYVTDEEAKTLMRDCKAFLFPSFYEGFGIPPLEAISAGAKEVAVSDIPVMHEVFGDEVLYIDPYEYNFAIFEKSSGVTKDCLKKFSWEASARQLFEIIKKYS